MDILMTLSYKSKMNKSLANSLRRFDKNAIFKEISEMIRSYESSKLLDSVDLDYRIKSIDSCLRKYENFYLEMRLEKVFNDILGFRMLLDNYGIILNGDALSYINIYATNY